MPREKLTIFKLEDIKRKMKNNENENKKKRFKISEVKFRETEKVPDTVHRDKGKLY